MAELTPDIAGDVVAACRSAADELVAAFGRAFDGQLIGVTIGEPTTHDAAQLPEGFDGPGLAVVLRFGDAGALALLPESSGLVPAWYAAPDLTGGSKLKTLAQELGMMMVPDSFEVDEYHAVRVEHLGKALALAEVASAAAHVPLALKCDEKQGQMSFIWPAAKPLALLPTVESPAAAPSPETEPAAAPEEEIPDYMRSFLRIEVPLSVQLASQKQSVHDILALVPGSIIKFDKSCDEMLDLVVGDQPIAEGEVVKVGDKFGLRIRGMIMPQEKFIAVKTFAAG
jgi:flagellar motor switch protein FliN